MKKSSLHGCTLRASICLLATLIAPNISLAQLFGPPSRTSCGCGKWTCPTCQHACPGELNGQILACPPTNRIDQDAPSADMPAVPSDSLSNAVEPGVENANPSPMASAAAAPSGIDFSRSLADSGTRSGGGAGSDLTRNAIAFQGDNFGTGGGFSTVSEFDGESNFPSETYDVIIPSSVTGRMKLAENVSPIPQDRFFLNYSLFNNVPLNANGITVNRLTPGFEKTFWNQLASIEVRTPLATTLDSNILADGSTDTSNAEFGNVFFALKGLLLSNDRWATSAGVSVSIPTADDNQVFGSQGTELLRVVNQSVHVMPFIGGFYTPSRRSFVQGIVQVDIDSNGNEVLARDSYGELSKIGTFQDSTFLYCDVAMGFWLVKRDHRNHSFIRGIIPVLEGHWNRSLNDADCVGDSSGFFNIVPPVKQLDVLNVLAGVTLQLHNQSRLAFGYALPAGNSADRVFDNELRVTWNKYY